MTTLCAAGHDTTAFFGCYFTFLLARHPRVQNKLKDHVRSVLKDGQLTPEVINTLLNGYLGQVFNETLRLYSVIPFIKREACKDTVVDSMGKIIDIPKGVELLIPICLINRDKDLWEDPNAFRPERWEGLPTSPSAKQGFFCFSYGTRSCIGKSMARVEMAAMAVRLVTRFSFREPPGGFRPDIVGGISLTSRNGIWVRVEKEEAA
ncbi:unnamed protein product [Heterosigma akashiwo]|uniref:Cytochrome P450 n=2 Tax=Heterosigma akashiwo TaxID=2829 RepID=A0A7S3UXI0_HETAK